MNLLSRSLKEEEEDDYLVLFLPSGFFRPLSECPSNQISLLFFPFQKLSSGSPGQDTECQFLCSVRVSVRKYIHGGVFARQQRLTGGGGDGKRSRDMRKKGEREVMRIL